MGRLAEAINNTNVQQNVTLFITKTDLEPTTSGANNNIDDKVDGNILGTFEATIKEMDIELTTSEINNDINVKFNIGVFMGRVINKSDVELNMGRLGKTNIIVKKEIYKSNLF